MNRCRVSIDVDGARAADEGGPIPATGPADAETVDLVDTLRNEVF